MLTDAQRDHLGEWLRTHCPFALTIRSRVGHGAANLAVRMLGRDESYSLCWLGAVDAMRRWSPDELPLHFVVPYRATNRLRTALKRNRLPLQAMYTADGEVVGEVEAATARTDDGPGRVDAADLLSRLRARAGAEHAALLDVIESADSLRDAAPLLGCSHTTVRYRLMRLRDRLANA